MEKLLGIYGVDEISEDVGDGWRIRAYVKSKLDGVPRNYLCLLSKKDFGDSAFMARVRENVLKVLSDHM